MDVSGLHLVQTVFGEALRGPITALAAGNVVADALVTPLSSTAVSRFLGIVSYNTEKKHEEALKVTRLHSMPNLVTLEKVLNNPEVMGALLAEMLGVAIEAHKKTLEDDPDVAELKRATVRLKAKGMVRGKGASLAGAFAELVAGESIAMNEAISESTTHTSGWTPDFGVIGRAISAIINDCCNDTKDAIAAKAPSTEEEAKKIMAEHMGGVMSVLVDVVQDMMKQRFDSAVKELPEKKNSEPTKDEVIEALKAAATPLIDMLSLNAVSLGTAISEFCTMVNSQHDYKWIGASVGAANVVMQACKMADLIEAVCVNGLEKVWEKGLESLENMISISISFYDSHVTRKTPHKGSIQALFGLKMRADTLLLNGSDANAMVMDLNAHRVEVGVVCYESDSKDTSGGVSLSLGKTLSVHGEWATHKRRTYVPTRQTAQFMRFGTPGHPVDELVIYGSQLIGAMGTGTIRKLILVDKADTHVQDGASWNASVNLKDLGKTGWDAVSSVRAGVKGGDSSKVVDGKAEFKCDGVEVLAIETITAETYDRRYRVNATKHFTPAGDAAGAGAGAAAAAYAPAYSGRLELGEDSVGFELPNVMFHEKTETTSEQITRRDAEQAALEAQRQREAAKKATEAEEERKKRQQEEVDRRIADAAELAAKIHKEAEEKRAAEAEAQRQRDLAAQRAAAAAQDTELQKEKINEALVNILTPGQLAQNVADARKPRGVLDLLISPVAGSVVIAPMPGFNPAMGIPALGNPVTAAGVAGVAVILGMDYQTQLREVAKAYEGWRKGDASLLPDMVWSQPAARDMMERKMGYPFGRPDLAPSAVTHLESPLPTRAPQACGGLDIPAQEKPVPIITPMPEPKLPEPIVTPLPEQRRPEPMITPVCDALVGLTEGFDAHRPSVEDLIKYKKKGGSGYEQPKAHPAPKDGLSAFPEAERVRGKTQVQGGGKLRERWKDRDFIYEWDAQHGTVEKYNKRGNHIGEFNPNTGEQTKPKDSKRRIEP